MEQNLSNEKKLVRRGSFRMAYNNEGKLLIGCIVAAVLCVLMFIVGLVLFGAPEDFNITVRELRVSAGAGFIVALTGDILTMPGLPKRPAAESIDVDGAGRITGLF